MYPDFDGDDVSLEYIDKARPVMDQRLAIGSKRLSALMVEIYGEDEPLYFAEVLTVFALIFVILAAIYGRSLLYKKETKSVKESPINSDESQETEEIIT